MSNDQTKQLLNDRGAKYGNTWKLAGIVMGELEKPFANLLAEAPEMSHNWVLMLSKLIRILFSPYEKDHYEDLIGYATLCLGEVEKRDEFLQSSSTQY